MDSQIPVDDNFTCVSALIDTSGSMINLDTNELSQGLTKMVRDQCLEGKTVKFYGAKFSDGFGIFADGIDASTVNITQADIEPAGMTCLAPAFARMIRYTSQKIRDMKERRPGNVIVVLLSDGEQTVNHLKNSDETDLPYEGPEGHVQLKKLVEKYKKDSNWTFMFLGTNFDVVSKGQQFGLDHSSCINYNYSTMGSRNVVKVCGNAMKRAQQGKFEGFTQKERYRSSDNTQFHSD